MNDKTNGFVVRKKISIIGEISYAIKKFNLNRHDGNFWQMIGKKINLNKIVNLAKQVHF